MGRVLCISGLAAIFVWAAPAQASGPIGGYLAVEKIVFEPNETAPTRVQIWGAISLVKTAQGYEYSDPQRGYLYYTIQAGNEELCRTEWADLKRAAGTNEVIGFGKNSDVAAMGHVRKATEEPAKPDVYPLGYGLERRFLIPGRPATFQRVPGRLLVVPAPAQPLEGDLFPPGELTLIAKNILLKEAREVHYVFELISPDGRKEVSSPIKPGEEQTSWVPKTKLQRGKKYSWSVEARGSNWQGPKVAQSFLVKS